MRLLFLFFLFALPSLSTAQQAEPCGFDVWQRRNRASVEAADARIAEALRSAATLGQTAIHNPAVKIIPVVVHVIHDGGASNISDSQIIRQIAILNEDFRRLPGTPGFGAGVDVEIEFCLAKKDPQGRCTNGIVRVNSQLSNHQTYQRAQLKQLSYWDNTRYLNMYVVKNINNGSGILGYAAFPGGPPDEDGIVVRHDYFGSTGTAVGGLGRTTTHEIGHWFGLYHTFQNGCGTDTCMGGDEVCDTPPVAAPNYNCPTNVNSCTNDSRPDQVQNYLDYTSDACKSIFTLGQRNRMHAALVALRPLIWTAGNITATGCDSGFTNGPCNVIADFTTPNTSLCVGASIPFYNRSQNTPLTYFWSFPGGTPATSTAANPIVTYNITGTFSVKLVVTNAVGTDSMVMPNLTSVTTPPVGQALPFYEGFESPVFPPNGITIDNPDTGVTWQRDIFAKAFEGLASAKINNLVNTNYGQSDALVLPSFDFTTVTGTPRLFFNWAYAKSDPSYSDELVVLASRDCGVTWNQIFYRTGTSMTTGPTQTAPYMPDSTTVWKSANIPLAAYAADRNVRIKIVNVTDGGNNLYIDRIALGLTATSIEDAEEAALQGVTVYPNPARDRVLISGLANRKLRTVRLTNALGQAVELPPAAWRTGVQTELQLPTGLPAGVYFLKIGTETGSVARKLRIEQY